MSNQLGDLLKHRQPQEPAEFQVIRTFVSDRLSLQPKLLLRNRTIVISMPNSAAAASLQLQLHDLRQQIQDYKLQIRIG